MQREGATGGEKPAQPRRARTGSHARPEASKARTGSHARPGPRARRSGAPVVPRIEVEARAAALLRRAPMPLVPLEDLYGALARELGAAAGDVLTLRERLVSRPDLFLVLERAAPIAGAEEWPPAEREAYAAALRAAGWGGGPLVGAAPSAGAREAPPATPEAHVAQALAQLAVSAARDEGLRERVNDALPLAEATMRVLAEAFRKKREAGDGEGAKAS